MKNLAVLSYRRFKLYLDEREIAGNVTSIFLHSHFLLATTVDHRRVGARAHVRYVCVRVVRVNLLIFNANICKARNPIWCHGWTNFRTKTLLEICKEMTLSKT